MSKKYTNQNLQNQKIMKDAVKNNEEIKGLNKIIKDKDGKITQIQTKVRCQEVENCCLQQQMKELQQKQDDSKKAHKLEITKFNNTLTSYIEEIYQLRNHNKKLVTKIKKLKSTKKVDNSNEDIEGKVLKNKKKINAF